MKMDIYKYQKNYASGFTLVELSIVIVIITLITGGIFSGQKLVQNAKLNNVKKEIREFDTATSQFKDKFKYYPGDFPNATSYWGTYSAGPPITGAINGNGTWWLDNGTEDFQFWRQLSLAGFIPGTYTGAVSGTNMKIGVNAPKSNYPGGGFDTYYNPAPAAYNTTGNVLEFGSATGSTGGWLNGQILTPGDSYSLDVKIDDGQATTGNLYGFRSAGYDTTAGKCVSSDQNTASASYVLTDTSVSCRIWWWLDKNK